MGCPQAALRIPTGAGNRGRAERWHTTLVYYLAQHDVDADIYADAARILQQAADDKRAGINPGMHVECINGKMIEV